MISLMKPGRGDNRYQLLEERNMMVPESGIRNEVEVRYLQKDGQGRVFRGLWAMASLFAL